MSVQQTGTRSIGSTVFELPVPTPGATFRIPRDNLSASPDPFPLQQLRQFALPASKLAHLFVWRSLSNNCSERDS